MTTTSIEQSKHLLELGLKPETADMNWSIYGHNGGKVFDGEYQLCFNAGCYEPDNEETDIPAWSLEGLLKMIPKNPRFKCAFREYHENKIIWTFWCHAVCEHEFEGETDLECIYKMICWLLENYYIKKEE